jgi:hypothetical protein
LNIRAKGSLLANLRAQPALWDKIWEVYGRDTNVLKERDRMKGSKDSSFRMKENGILRMGNRIYMPNDRGLKEKKILKEAHKSKLTIHPSSMKMYKDLKSFYSWPKNEKGNSGVYG